MFYSASSFPLIFLCKLEVILRVLMRSICFNVLYSASSFPLIFLCKPEVILRVLMRSICLNNFGIV